MSNQVALMQDEIAARLNADEYFEDITVITEREGDIENKINRALSVLTVKGEKIGVAVVVGAVTAQVESANVPGPHFDKTFLDLTVFENVVFNNSADGTLKAAVDIAVRCLQVLHHYYAAGVGQTLLADRNAITPSGEIKSNTIAYKARLELPLDNDVLDKVARPQISVAGTTVTIVCATDGASIYYTTDETYPWSGNAAAMLYSAPFIATAGDVVRAVAHKTNLVASDAAAETID